MFLGTARTSTVRQTRKYTRKRAIGKRRTTLGHLHKEKFLALFRFGDVRRNKWILCARGRTITFDVGPVEDTRFTYHKGLEVGTPPLSETISDFPVIVDPVGGVELTRIAGWCQSII
jgi:hypothetical protein